MKRIAQIGLIFLFAIIISGVNGQTPPPPPPFYTYNLAAGKITATTVDLSWEEDSYVDIHIFEVLIYTELTDSLVYQNIQQNTMSAHIEGLKINTAYKWVVVKLWDTNSKDLDKSVIHNLPDKFKTSAYTMTELPKGVQLSTDNISDEKNNQIVLSAYVSSADGNVHIRINKDKSSSNLQIFNISGQVVYNETINASGTLTREISLQSNAKGLYFVRLSNKSFIKTIKLSI